MKSAKLTSLDVCIRQSDLLFSETESSGEGCKLFSFNVSSCTNKGERVIINYNFVQDIEKGQKKKSPDICSSL